MMVLSEGLRGIRTQCPFFADGGPWCLGLKPVISRAMNNCPHCFPGCHLFRLIDV